MTASWPFDQVRCHRHTLAMTALQDEGESKGHVFGWKYPGAVLLLSAGDDGSGHPAYMPGWSEQLQEVAHPYPVEWQDYPDGGHAILFPYVPTTQLSYAHPVSGRISTGGGQPAPNAEADRHSWQQALAFLQRAVAAHTSKKENS